MKRILTSVIFVIFILSLISSNLHPLPPKGCATCWSKLNQSVNQLIMTTKEVRNGRYQVDLTSVRSALENAGVGDKVSLALKFGIGKTVTLGSWSSVVKKTNLGTKEFFSSMRDVTFNLPPGIKGLAPKGILVITAPGLDFNAVKEFQFIRK